MRSKKLLQHLIASCCIISICAAAPTFTCPMELSPLKYGGYITQNGKCVSFVPKEKIPKCGRYLHECLQEFCATEFSEGHLMHWDPKDLAKIKDPAMDKWKEAVKILNGRVLINRVTSVQRRRGQRDAWTNFDCINFETFCGKTCFPVEHCSWYTDGLNWHFGRWHNFYFISDFLGDLTPEHEQRRLEKIELPACRNAVLYHSPKKLPRVEDLYSCREKNFDYFACEHNKSAACEMKEERECHYNKQHNDCRLFKYKIIVPPGKQGRPCPTQKEEKCECPCSGTPEEWTQWSATCGVMSRSRYRPKDKMAADCKTDSKLCCKEEETHVGEDCKNYAFNTSINLREKPCKKGIKGVDAGGHLECVCDLGFTGVLCEAEINNCASNPCKNGATCESVRGVFVCHCATGWSGDLCDTRRKECEEGTCLNGGTCVRSADTRYCKCLPTYGGKNCEYPVHWCDDNTCNGRGECVNITHHRSFKCHCRHNFTGTRCEKIMELPEGEVVSLEIEPALQAGFIVVIVLIVLLILLFIGAMYSANEKRRRRRHHSSSYSSYKTSRDSQSSFSTSRTTKSWFSRRTRGTSKSRKSRSTKLSYKTHKPDQSRNVPSKKAERSRK